LTDISLPLKNSPMKLSIRIAIAAFFISTLSAISPAHASNWRISEDSVTLGMYGASAHVERLNGVDRVWRADGAQGTVASDCNDAGVCSPVSLSGRLGFDFTVVTFPNGSKRAYFKDMDPQSQQVYSAPCLDANCTGIGTRTATTEEMKVPTSTKAWGVPDAVLLPDGRVRIYIVESPVIGKCLEKVASYISTDGISFIKEPGWRFENGYVDTEILRAKANDYVMIMADIACTPSRKQQLFVSTSKDGLSWSAPEMLTTPGLFGLDPTGYESSNGVFRIYYTKFPETKGGEYVLGRATLTLTAAESKAPAVATPSSGTKKSISCVKGKTTKKVSGVNPKCPKGFKLK
jgi:hypothetical protein